MPTTSLQPRPDTSAAAGPARPHVNTRACRRRLVAFDSLAALSADLDRLEAAERCGSLMPLGNHAPGAIFHHLALAMRSSFDGFDVWVPTWLRWIGPLLKKRVLSRPFQPGFKLAARSEQAAWSDAVSFDEGLAFLRQQVVRAAAPGAAPSRPHPFFGAMTPQEWGVYHLRHAELHLSFLGIQTTPAEAPAVR